ncbi:hypothetical protein WL93_26640 [Burkholderia diffusa]|nr:hypothetical protein WL93_26640 [Burkholderia diffusa]
MQIQIAVAVRIFRPWPNDTDKSLCIDHFREYVAAPSQHVAVVCLRSCIFFRPSPRPFLHALSLRFQLGGCFDWRHLWRWRRRPKRSNLACSELVALFGQKADDLWQRGNLEPFRVSIAMRHWIAPIPEEIVQCPFGTVGIAIKHFNFEAQACVDAYRKARNPAVGPLTHPDLERRRFFVHQQI